MDGAGGGYPAHPRIHGARRESGCSPGRYRSRFLWKCSSPSRWHGGPQESFVAVGHLKRGGRLALRAEPPLFDTGHASLIDDRKAIYGALAKLGLLQNESITVSGPLPLFQ